MNKMKCINPETDKIEIVELVKIKEREDNNNKYALKFLDGYIDYVYYDELLKFNKEEILNNEIEIFKNSEL